MANLDSSKKLRIAMFTAVYAPFLSGISMGVQVRVRWLLERGHELLLIHPSCNSKYPPSVRMCSMSGLDELRSFDNFYSYAYPTKPLVFYKCSPEPLHYRHWSDTKVLDDFRPDIVLVSDPLHMWGFNSFFLGGYGRPIGSEYRKLTGTPIVSLFHTDYLTYGKYYLGELLMQFLSYGIPFLFKRFSKYYDYNFFSSNVMLSKYKDMGFNSCEYVPFLGIDSHKYHPNNSCYDPIPDDSRTVLLFAGRIAEEKNITQLLEAFPIISSQFPDVHLVIVGDGPQEDIIRSLASKFGSNVTVWGRSLGTEILGWFARADIFINPSTSENFCRTNMEALASGTPVITASAGGNPEQVEHGTNGFLFEPNNPVDLAERTIHLLENPNLKAKMAEQARPSVLKFEWSQRLKNFETKLYHIVSLYSNRHSGILDKPSLKVKELF